MSPRDRLGEMHVTVAAGGVDAQLESLRPELRMVKAALLYADSVTLTSPKLRVLRHVAATERADAQRRAAIEASGMTERPGWSAAITTYEGMRLGHAPTAEGRRFLERFAEELALFERLHEEQIERRLAAAGGHELDRAVQAGVVRLDPIPGDVTDPRAYSDEFQERMEEVFEAALDAERPTYPLFDAVGWLAVRPAFEASGATPADMTNTKEIALAMRFVVGEVEAFPDASMDAVLDVRERLKDPLTRFRAAMSTAAGELDSSGFDERFEREAQALYRRDVAPALLELREGLHELGVRETLRRGSAHGTGALTLGAAGIVAFSQLVAAAAGLAGLGVKDEWQHRASVRRTRRENNFFFLWQADQLLGHARR